MSKRKEYVVTLIFAGHIIQNLHYGPYCHNWWLSRQTDKADNIILLYPIRLNMKTLITLHNFDFIIEIVESVSEYGPAPGYLCKCKDIQSPVIMGFDNPIISDILIQDLPFQVYAFILGKLRVWILGIGKSSKPKWNYAGTEFDDNECKLTIYNKQMEQEETSTIIELQTSLHTLYPFNHIINDRELRTWKAMLKAVGCTEIMPFNKDQLEALDAFLIDKAHVVISSYKTDTATNEPRASFFKKLEGNKYTYCEDLGGLCHTCQQYGYEIFSDLTDFIDKYIMQSLEKKQLIIATNNLKRFLKRDYEGYFNITANGTTFHNIYINYCLLYTYGQCTECHTQICNQCQ
ncbi:11212_t:CDS:2, partial [Scutellospora calospora]